jgi:hypothetical protein
MRSRFLRLVIPRSARVRPSVVASLRPRAEREQKQIIPPSDVAGSRKQRSLRIATAPSRNQRLKTAATKQPFAVLCTKDRQDMAIEAARVCLPRPGSWWRAFVVVLPSSALIAPKPQRNAAHRAAVLTTHHFSTAIRPGKGI